MVIYKYPISPNCTYPLPKDAQILTVQVQHGEPIMWVKLDDTDQNKVVRQFTAIPTGATFPDEPLDYIATFQLSNRLVYHVFEVLRND